MKIVFALYACFALMAAVGVTMVSKSAIHEILAVLLGINFILSLAAFAVLSAMEAHTKVVKRIHNHPDVIVK